MKPEVIFKEDTHQYFSLQNEEYISCTTLIKKFEQPFLAEKFASIIASKEKTTKEIILERWEHNAKKSTDYGTELHKCIEGYIKNENKYYINSKLCEIAKNGYKKIIEYIGKEGLESEKLLWNHEYKIAGQSDIVQFTNGFDKKYNKIPIINIGDIKTNNKIDYFSPYNDYLKYPLNHLMQCNFNIYALQLSLYAFMLNKLYPEFKIGTLFLMHYDKLNDIWTRINIPYMLYEVKAMLTIYNNL